MPHATDARQHYGLTFAVLALGGAAYALLQSLVAPALPDIQRELHTSATSATWVLTAYLLSASVVTPIAGRLGDMFGKARTLVIALSVLAVGTLVAALAKDVTLLIAGRVIQGAGGAVFPLAFGIIRDEFPRERVATGIALISAILGIGGGLGIVLAGPIIDALSYHWLFWFPLIPVLISTALAILFVPESPVKVPGRINWTGAMLLSGWLVCGLLGVSQGAHWGWGDPRVLGLFAAALVGGVLWVGNEWAAPEPLVDMRMMRLRGVWTVNLAAFLIGAGMFCSFVLIPQFVEEPSEAGFGFAANVTQAGLFLVPSTLMMLVVSPLAGRLANRVGSRVPLVLGAFACTVSFTFLAAAHDHRWEIYVAATILGIGIGLAFASLANLIVEAVPPHQTGVATGMNTVMRSLGGSVGGQVGASIIAGNVAASGLPTEHGFTLAFAFAAVVCAVSVLSALAIPAPGRRRPVGEPAPASA